MIKLETMTEAVPYNPNKDPNPPTQETEVIPTPQRLAEVVLNTINRTFDPKLLQFDGEKIGPLLTDPQANWPEIRQAIASVAINAASANSQIDAMNKSLRVLIDDPDRRLPVAKVGKETIIDRRGIEQILKQKQAERLALEERRNAERKDWNIRRKTIQAEKDRALARKQDDKKEAQILSDEVLRTARVITRIQEDGITPFLTTVIGYSEILPTEYQPKSEQMVGLIKTGLENSQRYQDLEKAALRNFSQGINLPDQEAATLLGSGLMRQYVEKAASPPPPAK